MLGEARALRAKFEAIRRRARETILAKYTLARCLPIQTAMIESLAREHV